MGNWFLFLDFYGYRENGLGHETSTKRRHKKFSFIIAHLTTAHTLIIPETGEDRSYPDTPFSVPYFVPASSPRVRLSLSLSRVFSLINRRESS